MGSKLENAMSKISVLEGNLSSVQIELEDILDRVCKLEIIATSPHIADGNELCNVYVKAYNVKGQPVSNAVIALLSRTRDSSRITFSYFHGVGECIFR